MEPQLGQVASLSSSKGQDPCLGSASGDQILLRALQRQAAVSAQVEQAAQDDLCEERRWAERLRMLHKQTERRLEEESLEGTHSDSLRELLDRIAGAIRDRKTTLRSEGYQAFLFDNKDVYEGEWKNSRMHGRGVLKSAEAGYLYEGEWFLGTRNGTGTYHSLQSKTTYDGRWSDGRKHGKGELSEPEGTYRGEFRDGRIVGLGEYVYTDGHVYRGEWVEGLYEGTGTYTAPGGSKYDGSWKRGRENGRGTQTYASGHMYVGEWVNGYRHGEGTYKCDEFTYTGEWTYGTIAGRGTFKHANKTEYVGEWFRGNYHGHGQLKDGEGRTYTGEFTVGKRHGKGQYESTWPFHGAYEGEWVKGKKQGKGTLHFPGGVSYVGEWDDGLPHGVGKITTPSGKTDVVKFEKAVCVARDDADVFKRVGLELDPVTAEHFSLKGDKRPFASPLNDVTLPTPYHRIK